MGTAGAWRLGQWDLLEDHLGAAKGSPEQLGPEDAWEIRIGTLLLSINSRW